MASGGQRRLTFGELYSLALGGQSPFISLMAFGTPLVAIAGSGAALSMMVATALVLINGSATFLIARRFKRGGGYYVYSLYGLSERLGFVVGWMYLLYSLAYGGSLVVAGAYIIKIVASSYGASLPDYAYVAAVAAVVIGVALAGVKASAKFAWYTSLLGIAVIVAISGYLFWRSGLKLYNPFVGLTPGVLYGALYGLGIPSGYGAITPLAGEAKRPAHVGLAILSAIGTGGALATFFFYALAALGFTGNLARFLLTEFGVPGLVFISAMGLASGGLGGVAYIMAASRVIYNMARDGFFHVSLASSRGGRPLAAEALAAAAMLALLLSAALIGGLAGALEFLGALAGLLNLFVHAAAGVSLARISLRRLSIRRVFEALGGAAAAIFSIALVINGLGEAEKLVGLTFMGWLVLGFFYLEILDIIRAGEEKEE
ncbi:MAG: APC family permease [Thermoproteus sp. AZ2]|uniref:APC family permease n=1 Tax=Thermoproteus sp. AZ2 TaxID=1609232 RepID=A0ACC6UZH5_9CREN